MQVAEEKTHLTQLGPRQRGEKGVRRHITFLGFSIRLLKKNNGKGYVLAFCTESKRFTRAKAALKEKMLSLQHQPLETQHLMLNSVLRGHFNYYGFAGNSRRIAAFRYEAECLWRRSLSRRGDRRSGWLWMRRITAKFPLALARIRIGYPMLEEMAVMQ